MALEKHKLPGTDRPALERGTSKLGRRVFVTVPRSSVRANRSCLRGLRNPLTQSDNLLCSDCSRSHTFVLELFRESAPLIQTRLQAHPELTADDLNRIRRVFIWRSSKIGLVRPPQADVTVHA